MSNALNRDPKNVIAWFDDFNDENDKVNRFRFLSNFYVGAPIIIDGLEFQTGEHAFQAYKAQNYTDFEIVGTATSPGAAKALGRRIPLREDWEAVKYDVMALVVRSKFTLDREEGDLLLNTGDALLVEGTYWGDQVWGVALQRDSGQSPRNPALMSHGRNWLGTLLMARRAELRAMEQVGDDALEPLIVQSNLQFVTPVLGW